MKAEAGKIDARLGTFDTAMVVVSLVVGIGIFRTPAIVARATGTPGFFLLAWGIGGLVSLVGALVFAEIGSRHPRAGGYYRVVADCYHPALAFSLNWAQTLMQGAGAAGVAFIGAEYLVGLVLPPERRGANSVLYVALCLMLVLLLLNGLGIRVGARDAERPLDAENRDDRGPRCRRSSPRAESGGQPVAPLRRARGPCRRADPGLLRVRRLPHDDEPRRRRARCAETLSASSHGGNADGRRPLPRPELRVRQDARRRRRRGVEAGRGRPRAREPRRGRGSRRVGADLPLGGRLRERDRPADAAELLRDGRGRRPAARLPARSAANAGVDGRAPPLRRHDARPRVPPRLVREAPQLRDLHGHAHARRRLLDALRPEEARRGRRTARSGSRVSPSSPRSTSSRSSPSRRTWPPPSRASRWRERRSSSRGGRCSCSGEG